jgi:hypothetical protein
MPKKKKKVKHTYVVRKFVIASSAPEAIRLSAKIKVHDVYVDMSTAKKKEEDATERVEAIGFSIDKPEEDDDEEEEPEVKRRKVRK